MCGKKTFLAGEEEDLVSKLKKGRRQFQRLLFSRETEPVGEIYMYVYTCTHTYHTSRKRFITIRIWLL